MPTHRELEILDRYLDPPDELEDDDEYDRKWDTLSNIRYEEMRENEVLNRE